MNTYWIACTVFMTVCAIACIWLFVKAKKEHDCAMWTLRATDDLMCRAVEILQRVDKDVDRLKVDVEKAKREIDAAKDDIETALHQTDTLKQRVNELTEYACKNIDKLTIGVWELKKRAGMDAWDTEPEDAQVIMPEGASPVDTDWNVKCHARHCAPRKTAPIDWEDEGE